MAGVEYWNDRYVHNNTPWDSGQPDEHLVAVVEAGGPVGRALEIGCGTGTNARYLAGRGAERVLAVDIAPTAIERARAALGDSPVELAVLDILNDPLPEGTFDFIYDRGCLHVFDDPALRSRFASRVAALLTPGGRWLSLVGSAEGPGPAVGPPRRTLGEVCAAIEPHLQLTDARLVPFDSRALPGILGWRVLSQHRPA